VKPSREQLTGSVDASHLTTEDPVEPDCIVTASDIPKVSCEPCIPTSSHDTVDAGNTAGWNSGAAAVLKRYGTADRAIRARSYPPAGKVTSAVDDWFGLAPLASPETLSESSSLASCGSSGAVAGVGYQRIMSVVLPPRMDPILQSPARSSNSRDCCLYLESADVVGDLATLSPCVENLPSPLAPCHHGPDIVPVQPFGVTGLTGSCCSSTAAARVSSPDVIQETRSATSVTAVHHAPANGLHRMQSGNLSQDYSHHSNRMSSDTSRSSERGACTCGHVRPDIVSTHDCRCAALRSTDD